jgi:hypothetical protein
LKVAIQRRIVLCLAEPAWLHVPFLGSPKTEFDHLHDLALEIPTLLARTTKIVQHAKSRPLSQSEYGKNISAEACPSIAVLELMAEYEALLFKMEKWFHLLVQRYPGPLYWSMKHSLQHASASPPLEVDPQCIPTFTETSHQLRFPNSQIAGMLANFWSYQLDLLLGLIELEQSPAAYASHQVKLELHYGLASEKALSILDTMPYLQSCFEGTISAAAPMKTVYSYFVMVRDKR